MAKLATRPTKFMEAPLLASPDLYSDGAHPLEKLPGFFENKIFVLFINQAVLIECKSGKLELEPSQVARNVSDNSLGR